MERNPFEAPRGPGSSPLRIKPKSRSWHHLTPDEFRRLLAVVENTRHRAAFWLMYGCGLRAGEVYNLTSGNVGLEYQRVHVANRAATPELPPFMIKADGQSTETKERSIAIPEAALVDITNALRDSLKSGGLIALTPRRFARVQKHWRLCREGKPWGGRTFWRPWQNRDMMNNLLRDTKAYLRSAGVELSAPFTLHTFRKSFAQNHADTGTPPRTLAKLLGHANNRITMQFYNRVTDANERAAADTMDRLFAKPTDRQAV